MKHPIILSCIILLVILVLLGGFWYTFRFTPPFSCPKEYHKIGFLNKSIENKEDVLREITNYAANQSNNPDIIMRYTPFTIDEISSKKINGEQMWVFSHNKMAVNSNGTIYGIMMCL